MADVCAVIEELQSAVEEVFSQLGETTDRPRRGELVRHLCELVDLGIGSELEVLYPVVEERVGGGSGFATVSREQFGKARGQLSTLRSSEPAEPQFDPAVGQLHKVLKEQFADERLQLFPRLKQDLDPATREQLGHAIEIRIHSTVAG